MKRLDVPHEFRRGARGSKPEENLESARALIRLLCRRLGVADLGSADMLDMGCGSKLVEAFLLDDLPIRHYTGVDIEPGLIGFLRREVDDPRFAFHCLDARNAMYNPDGAPFTDATRLPEDVGDFDLISLFSVFTHLDPADYVTMLRLLRRHVRPNGVLLYSLYVNERTPGGHGLVDQMSAAIDRDPARLRGRYRPAVPDFVDAGNGALRWALYSRSHALALIEGTGWRLESLNDPEPFIQHYAVCRPC